MAAGSPLPPRVAQWLRERQIPEVLFYYLVVNVAVFLLGGLFRQFETLWLYEGEGSVSDFFSLPAALPRLLRAPWTLVTYMFYHEGFTHILFNMLWLWGFGRLFLMHFGAAHFHRVYCLGGVAGGVAYVLAYNIFPYFAGVLPVAIAMGASASVMAITLAAVVRAPWQEVYLFGMFRVRIVWIAVGVVLIDLFSITVSNAGGHIAHLGGALFGFVYARWVAVAGRRRSSHSFSFSPLSPFLAFGAWVARFRRQKATPRPRGGGETAEEEAELQRILAKLARGGYAALSAAEKEKLFRRRS